MKVKFVSDSSCDMLVREGVNYCTVPLTITIGNQHFKDDLNLDKSAFLDALDAAREASKSACPSLQAWTDAFEGNDVVYVVTVTSGLSGTYNSARLAKDMYLEDHPDTKIHIFDSLSTGPEMSMIMDKIIELDGQGYGFEEVVEKVHEYQKHTHLLFVLGSLHTMAMNGRVSKVVASACGVLGIHVAAIASEKGEVEVVGKCRGAKKLQKFLVEKMKETGYKGGKIRFGYVDNQEMVQKLKDLVLAEFPNAQISFQETTALCSYYCERNGFMIAYETE